MLFGRLRRNYLHTILGKFSYVLQDYEVAERSNLTYCGPIGLDFFNITDYYEVLAMPPWLSSLNETKLVAKYFLRLAKNSSSTSIFSSLLGRKT